MTTRHFSITIPRTQAAKINTRKLANLLAKENGSTLTVCPTCGEEYPNEDLSEINDEGTRCCPRCIFIIALYSVNGIKKRLSTNSLRPEALNSRFQKILKDEFYPHPKETYQKYLGAMIQEEEAKHRIIWVKKADLNKIRNDWPFFFMTDDQVERFKPEDGAELTLKAQDSKDEIKRRIYSHHRLTRKHAMKYGLRTAATACFIPENFND